MERKTGLTFGAWVPPKPVRLKLLSLAQSHPCRRPSNLRMFEPWLARVDALMLPETNAGWQTRGTGSVERVHAPFARPLGRSVDRPHAAQAHPLPRGPDTHGSPMMKYRSGHWADSRRDG